VKSSSSSPDSEADGRLALNLTWNRRPTSRHFNVLLRTTRKYLYLCITWSGATRTQSFMTPGRRRLRSPLTLLHNGPYVDCWACFAPHPGFWYKTGVPACAKGPAPTARLPPEFPTSAVGPGVCQEDSIRLLEDYQAILRKVGDGVARASISERTSAVCLRASGNADKVA